MGPKVNTLVIKVQGPAIKKHVSKIILQTRPRPRGEHAWNSGLTARKKKQVSNIISQPRHGPRGEHACNRGSRASSKETHFEQNFANAAEAQR